MKRVLFVDDEPRILDGLRRMLRGQRGEWEMVFASGGEAALAQLEGEPVDVVVTDMRMPGLDGVELLTRVQERHPRALRVVLSGHTNTAAAARAARVAHQFISKPSSPDVVRGVVERICALGAGIPREIRARVGGIGAFPIAASAYDRIAFALAALEGSAEELTEMVEQEPAVAAKLLQVVNSSFFGISPQVADVASALRMLSRGTVRELVLSAGVFLPLPAGAGPPFDAEELRSHSVCIATAVAAADDGGAGYAAGLLHDIGKPILAYLFPERYPAIVTGARARGLPLHLAEEEALGTTHARVGAYLLGIWNLPAEVVAAVDGHHDRDADGLAAAIRLAHSH